MMRLRKKWTNLVKDVPDGRALELGCRPFHDGWRRGVFGAAGGVGLIAVAFVLLMAAQVLGMEPRDKEQWVMDELAAGRVADLAATNSPYRTNRHLRAEFLRDLLTDDSLPLPASGLRIDHAIFREPIELQNHELRVNVHLNGCIFERGVLFSDCELKKGLELDRSTFREQVDFRRVKVAASLTANNSLFTGPALFQGAKIGGSLWMTNSKFLGKTEFGYAGVGEEFSLKRSAFSNRTEGVEFYRSTIGGLVSLDGARFVGPANFIQMTVRGNLSAAGAEFLNTDDLAADVRRQSHYNADFGSLRVEGFSFFIGVRFDGEVSFRNARFARLYLDEVRWPTNLHRANTVRLEWMRYDSIQATTNFAHSESNRASTQWKKTQAETWTTLKPVLATRAPYSADVYSSLENYFKQEGANGLAREVGFENARQYRQKVLWSERGFGWLGLKAAIGWFWNLLLQVTVGHGHYPIGALAWSLGLVLIGCRVFRIENMQPVPGGKRDTRSKSGATGWRRYFGFLRSRDSTYHAFWYSLDMFIPIIEIEANDGWRPDPKNRFAWHYLTFHRTLGVILVPIGLAAFSGILK